MSKTLTSLLVGMHFRPPAEVVTSHLPSGASLQLVPEPENPYDASAVRVECSASAIPETQYEALEAALDGTGFDLNDVLTMGPIHLGYVAASGGKPLLKAGLAVGNKEFLELLNNDRPNSATLTFGADGSPRVTIVNGETP